MNYDNNFERAISFTLMWEGGYTNNPNDAGGETNFGISKRSYPNLDIANLTQDDAKKIYYFDYWVECRCHVLPFPLSICILDMAVHAGPSKAIKNLQSVLNVSIDGQVGPETIDASEKAPMRGLITNYNIKRMLFLFNIISSSDFITGWTKRIFNLMEYSLRFYTEICS